MPLSENRRPFQFGLGSLVMLITVAAVLLSLSRTIAAMTGFQGLMMVYGLVVFYFVLVVVSVPVCVFGPLILADVMEWALNFIARTASEARANRQQPQDGGSAESLADGAKPGEKAN